ncbi:MAG: AEC family transporter [Clostridia bacterium]|nr:AEC family transporter [Clostridia bacterium]
MENLILSFNVVLPLFLNIALGYALRCMHMMDEFTQKNLNKLVFKVFLPIYVFNNIYTTNIAVAFQPGLVALTMGGVLAIFAFLMAFVPKVETDNAKRGVMIQAIFRSNFVLFGLPVAVSLCGENNVGPTSLLVGFVVPVFNVLAVVCLEAFRGSKPDVKKMLRGIATNPLIIASVLGIAMNLAGLPLPTGVHKSITDLGRIATPLALVALGAGFQFGRIRGYTRQLLICISGKLVLCPLLMLTLAAMLGFRNEMLVPVLALFGSPVATSSYTMAELMGGDGTLAGSLVVLTTAFSIFTMFLFIFGLKQLGLV